MSKLALITGSTGLIGAEAVRFLIEKDFTVIGIDNNIMSQMLKSLTKVINMDFGSAKYREITIYRQAYFHLLPQQRTWCRIQNISIGFCS